MEIDARGSEKSLSFCCLKIDNKFCVSRLTREGSGTTGQAVLDLNKDGGKRTFILCTNNEITDTNPNGIVYDVTSKRLKRVMTGKCYDGSTEFELARKGFTPYGDNLDVYEIKNVTNFEKEPGKTAFEVIDETLYGKSKCSSLKEKIDWVCTNFEGVQKTVETDDEWKNRVEENSVKRSDRSTS